MEFAQDLMKFADDALLEMTKNPEMESADKMEKSMEIREDGEQIQM